MGEVIVKISLTAEVRWAFSGYDRYKHSENWQPKLQQQALSSLMFEKQMILFERIF